MVRKRVLTPVMIREVILHGQDRLGLVSIVPEKRIRNIYGLDGKPMADHYSWVRTQEEMIKKVQTFDHKSDLNWISLIENQFSQDFNGTDFINGYEYEIV
ncbi:hypothetical protein SCALIN_C05_0082 [Candidatus Scalindua japonica]|uniref:Uncharacterized protein n=1 Tax=Candidatus Scalindua japonica TaxID=1284222 RepID=A0A286TVR6_9BACT|nr:hypothetical protein [Candidatus Scalindua japonica]GAX59997.1 hypothetical protein SCALIN_C05_0082 [Candidatus Scalindua japonica]